MEEKANIESHVSITYLYNVNQWIVYTALRSGVTCVTGEWLNNKKNGYGVTTLRDGTRLAGKYRRNVLLSSTSDVKPFLMRTNRLREQVENATKEAEHAAKLAKDRAQIAQSR